MRRLGRVQARAVSGADIHFEVAAFGDDIRARAAVDDADIDRDARPAAIERVQVAHDAGGLEDGVAALLRLDAGMRRPPVDRRCARR